MAAFPELIGILPFLLLGAALALALCRPPSVRVMGRDAPPWLGALLGCLAAAMVSGALSAAGLAAAGVLFGLGWWQARGQAPWSGWVAWPFGLMALALALHKVPGFHNRVLCQDLVLSAGAWPFSLHVNLDKGLAGLALLVFAAGRWRGARGDANGAHGGDDGDRAISWRQTVLAALSTAGVVLALAVATGLVRWRPPWEMTPGWPSWAWRFMVVNLLFTCVAEEAFFRGLIQGAAARWLAHRRWPQWPAVLLSGVLFGLAHLGGGGLYAALAVLAGIGYGWIAWRTGRVEWAIAAHFLLNAAHFLFFTYPRLA